MTRQYKTSYKSRRGVKRFGVSVPYPTEPPPNDQYWKDKFNTAFEVIVNNPILSTIWDSDLVPSTGTAKDYALLALRLAMAPYEIHYLNGATAPNWGGRKDKGNGDQTKNIVSQEGN